ncbi:MAG: YggU family protein [Deltaproteobacteria bacterium]|nr:MAG: YggU family protein [Deltaproteobacteria bacterium]
MEEGVVTLKIHLQPRASRDGIDGLMEDALKVRVTSPPREGRANKALRKFLAERLGLSPSQVEIIAGQHSRKKLLRISGISKEDMERTLGVDLPPL